MNKQPSPLYLRLFRYTRFAGASGPHLCMAEMGLVASIQPFVGWKGGVARRMIRPTYADKGREREQQLYHFCGVFPSPRSLAGVESVARLWWPSKLGILSWFLVFAKKHGS